MLLFPQFRNICCVIFFRILFFSKHFLSSRFHNQAVVKFSQCLHVHTNTLNLHTLRKQIKKAHTQLIGLMDL